MKKFENLLIEKLIDREKNTAREKCSKESFRVTLILQMYRL